jgi:DNA-directed RNA polymerase subunit RPC12/RpoP
MGRKTGRPLSVRRQQFATLPEIHFECPKCSQPIDAPQEMAAQLVDCPNCKEVIEVPVRSSMPAAGYHPVRSSAEKIPSSQHSDRPYRYEHIAIVLHFDHKKFAMTRTDLLQGLTGESKAQLNKLGEDGWELVAVLPYTTGRAALSMFASNTETDAAMGFFKRVKLA